MELKDIVQREKELQKIVYVDNDNIVINVVSEYPIKITRCDTAEKLLHWIWHLTEKTWMNNEVMRRFIEVACQESNIERRNA